MTKETIVILIIPHWNYLMEEIRLFGKHLTSNLPNPAIKMDISEMLTTKENMLVEERINIQNYVDRWIYDNGEWAEIELPYQLILTGFFYSLH